MADKGKQNRLDSLMDQLGIRASSLAQASGADHSLITKWRRGERALTRRSHHLPGMARGLIKLDKDGKLEELMAPWQQRGESMDEALCEYLTGEDLSALPARVEPPKRKTTGDYTVQYRVYLGQEGFCNAALTMLDYVLTLPPGREIRAVCHGNYGWMVSNIPFVVQFVQSLRKALSRGTTITLVNRTGYSPGETAAFAGPWLVAHLRGSIRSRYYDGPMPEGARFIGSIQGYWSLRVAEDPEVEDNLCAHMFTDPVNIRPDEEAAAQAIAKSRSLSQYGFFAHPEGDEADPKMWPDSENLPAWPGGDAPDGTFYAATRVPSIGIMTAAEFERVAEGDAPRLPGFLFGDGTFPKGAYRIMLCREDVQEGLAKTRRMNEPLSDILHRRAFIPGDMLAAQLRRLLAVMDSQETFEVALVPRVAFERFQAEIVCWKNSATVAWLQNRGQSVYTCAQPTSGAFHGTVAYVWDRLLAGWKRKERVARQLRKWLAGKGLDEKVADSAVVRGWDVLPRE